VQWRAELGSAQDAAQLAATASRLLSRRVGLEVEVRIEGEATAGARPLLHAVRGEGSWRVALVGWEAAPPGPRRLAELFATVLADAALQLEHAQQAEQRERERQLQARLAELGSLAASVAHDLRNPLNIIAMAVATAPKDTRQEVAEQVQRISRLAEDLLDYARPWQVHPVEIDAALHVREAVRRTPQVELGEALRLPLPLRADPMRFSQALGNLLSNAQAAARRVRIDAEHADAAVLLHVCDDGPGVPDDLRDRLFEPFASRSPGGTGLGLAIVARIMAAHGGSVRLAERPPWNTCFTLTFPAAA
jgi:signal transduction histidine kinase